MHRSHARQQRKRPLASPQDRRTERGKRKDIDILPTENAKKEPPPCRDY